MSAPVLPTTLKASLADPADNICGNFIDTLLKFPKQVWQLFDYIFTSAGLVKDSNTASSFKQDVNYVETGQIIMSCRNDGLGTDRWLFCNGQAVSRTTYANLFAIIGTTFGSGDGSTTFNVPDMRDRFPVGTGSTYSLADTGGSQSVTLTAAQIPSHAHNVTSVFSAVLGSGSGAALVLAATGSYGGATQPDIAVTSSGSGSSHENRPPYMALRFYIKT